MNFEETYKYPGDMNIHVCMCMCVCFKESAPMFVEAEKSQNLHLEHWGPRRSGGTFPV